MSAEETVTDEDMLDAARREAAELERAKVVKMVMAIAGVYWAKAGDGGLKDTKWQAAALFAAEYQRLADLIAGGAHLQTHASTKER